MADSPVLNHPLGLVVPSLPGFLCQWAPAGGQESPRCPVAYGAAALHTLVGLAAGEELAAAEHLSLLVRGPVVLAGPGGRAEPGRRVRLWKRDETAQGWEPAWPGPRGALVPQQPTPKEQQPLHTMGTAWLVSDPMSRSFWGMELH